MTTWTKKDGSVVDIAKMDDKHLRNTIRMMRRNGYIEASTFRFYAGSRPSGDAAQDCFDRELDHILGKTPSSVLDDLMVELRRRGLKEIRPTSADILDEAY